MTEEALIADRLDELRKEMELRFTGEFVDNAVNRLDSASNFLRRIANQPPAQDGLVDAARNLVERLEFIHEHPAFKSVWVINQIHTGPYDGPQYETELNAVKAALASLGTRTINNSRNISHYK